MSDEVHAYMVLSTGVWKGTVVGNTDDGNLILRLDGKAESVPFPLILSKPGQ